MVCKTCRNDIGNAFVEQGIQNSVNILHYILPLGPIMFASKFLHYDVHIIVKKPIRNGRHPRSTGFLYYGVHVIVMTPSFSLSKLII